jgi:putative transposase
MSDPHSKNLRLHRLRDLSSTFFVTRSLRPKKPVLNSELRHGIVEAFAFAAQSNRIYLRAFVVMPDHWRALIGLREPWTLPRFMHSFMSHVGATTSAHLRKHHTAWQDGYYETLIKTARQFTYIALYTEENPVKKGLASTPEEWEGSSLKRKDLITDAWPWIFDRES